MRAWPFIIMMMVVALAAARRRDQDSYRVVDGDSLQIGNERVRLADIYAAERHEPGGREAQNNMQHLIDSGVVHIHYGQTLADLYVDDQQVSQDDIGPSAGRGSRRRY
jgi:endonuclease YncB( thermonuclease family)